MDPHLRGCLCRTCWMLGIPWLLLSTWKTQGPDRQLYSPLPAFPFSSLCSPWKCPFSAFSALSASPSLLSDCSTSGTTQFHSFVSLPLLLVMSGPRAIGIFRLPWKNITRCQTLFFLAKLHGAGERTMCLFSPHPQTSSALPLSSPRLDPPILYLPTLAGTCHMALPT